MYLRKTIILFLLLSLVLAMVGCSGSNGGTEQSKNSTVTEADTSQGNDSTKETAKPKKDVELSLWTWKLLLSLDLKQYLRNLKSRLVLG